MTYPIVMAGRAIATAIARVVPAIHESALDAAVSIPDPIDNPLHAR
jgi:hypothetical protein